MEEKGIITSKKIENLDIGRMFYSYKNIRMYHNVKYNNINQTYWFAILLLDKDYYSWPNTGKLIPHIDIRSLPGFDKEKHDGFQLITSPQKVVPKLFRNAMKEGVIKEDMFVDWNEKTNDFGIEDV